MIRPEIKPEHARWQMFWQGKMRPATWLGNGKSQVDHPAWATTAVLFMGDDSDEDWLAIQVFPGEIVARQGYERVNEWVTIE